MGNEGLNVVSSTGEERFSDAIPYPYIVETGEPNDDYPLHWASLSIQKPGDPGSKVLFRIASTEPLDKADIDKLRGHAEAEYHATLERRHQSAA